MAETYAESNNSTPIFFVLFPGVDPTPQVENIAREYDISIAPANLLLPRVRTRLV